MRCRCNTRIIPAYAGQISSIYSVYNFREDHPRIRGTNSEIFAMKSVSLGSSPHTRDKFGKVYEKYGEVRIIPAYAGQIGTNILHTPLRKDHPRIRGTNANMGMYK